MTTKRRVHLKSAKLVGQYPISLPTLPFSIPGSAVRRFRTKHRLSQAELGDIIGRSPDTIWHWESGRHPVPPEVAILVRVLTTYGIAIETVRKEAA